MKQSLTPKQQRLLEFIYRYLSEYRRTPLIREIQAGCDNLSYKSTVDRLNALERKGWIRRIPNKHRGIRIRRKLIEFFARFHQGEAPDSAAAGALEAGAALGGGPRQTVQSDS